MSELNSFKNGAPIRLNLLMTVSALALVACATSLEQAYASDADRPTVWIELGGQLSALGNAQDTFSPPLMDGRPAIFDPSQKFEKPPRHSFDESGAISLRPEGSGWAFSASVQYGHSKSSKHKLQQTNPSPVFHLTQFKYPVAQRFAATDANATEQHVIVDFQAGRDVGVGLFKSRNSSSVISFGVRFVQFSSTSNVALKSDPDWHFTSKYLCCGVSGLPQAFHNNLASMTAQRSFHGIGPSVSWKSSVPVLGNSPDGEIEADWGVNGAILFGRQRARTHHQSTARYKSAAITHSGVFALTTVPKTIGRYPATPDHIRSHGIVVPNIGGFAGLSFKYDSAKLSFGYRADFFLGAMDGGIDTRKTYDRNFYGPYATISIGLP